MKLELITDFKILDANRHQWDRVARDFELRLDGFDDCKPLKNQATPFPFYSWAWLGNWFRQYSVNDSKHVLQPAVVVATNHQGDWIGVAPFCIDDSSSFGKQIRWWGSGSVCSDYMGQFCHREHEQAFALALADWLAEATNPGGELAEVDFIELEGGTSQSLSNRQLDEALDAVGFGSSTVELEGCWMVELPDSWESLNQRFSKSMRRKTKKAIQRMGGPETTVRSSAHLGVDTVWSDFVDLHQGRREMLGQEGCFADEAFTRFLKLATTELVEMGLAELLVIDFENQPLASMLLLNDGVTNFMYQSGVDVARMTLEPGYQVAYCSIQRSIELGLQRFDFLRGDEPYKSRWDTTRIPLNRTRWVPRKFSSVVKHNLWLTGRSLKHWFLGNGQSSH